jgi:hypothetical protein
MLRWTSGIAMQAASIRDSLPAAEATMQAAVSGHHQRAEEEVRDVAAPVGEAVAEARGHRMKRVSCEVVPRIRTSE